MLKFKVELEYSELVYVRLDMLEKIKKYLESARYWKSEGETKLCRYYIGRAVIYRNIVKAIDKTR